MTVDNGATPKTITVYLVGGGYVLTYPVLENDGAGVSTRTEAFTSLGAMKRKLNETLDLFKEVKGGDK